MKVSMRVLRSLRILFGVIAVTLLLDIVMTRYVLPDSVMKIVDLEIFSRVYSPIYHHGLLPKKVINAARWGKRSYPFATNSLGFKDSMPRDVPLVGTRRRVVIIGDSFIEGSGYSASETFVGRTSEALAPEGVEVFNAGVNSYSPAIYYRRTKYLLDELGFRFDELVVFLDISDIYDEANRVMLDEYDNVVSRGRSSWEKRTESVVGSVRRFLKQSSITYRVVSTLKFQQKRLATQRHQCQKTLAKVGDVRAIDQERLAEELMSNPVSSWTTDDNAFTEWGKRGLQIAAGNLIRLRKLVETHGIGMTLVIYPWPTQIFGRDLESRQVIFWRAWAAENNVEFVNLFPDFVGSKDPFETYLQYFIPCDVHWNADGHQYVADLFLRHYRNRVSAGGVVQ